MLYLVLFFFAATASPQAIPEVVITSIAAAAVLFTLFGNIDHTVGTMVHENIRKRHPAFFYLESQVGGEGGGRGVY